MVINNTKSESKSVGGLRRVMYSAAGLGIIGGVVAVLGAPVKWA